MLALSFQNAELLKDLLKEYETKLPDAAKGELSLHIFNLFAEAKRIQEIHMEEEVNQAMVFDFLLIL